MKSATSAAAAIGAEHSVVHWSGIYLQGKMGEWGIPAPTPLHQRDGAQKTSVGHWTPHSSTRLPCALWCWMKDRRTGWRVEHQKYGMAIWRKTGWDTDQGGEVSSTEGLSVTSPGPLCPTATSPWQLVAPASVAGRVEVTAAICACSVWLIMWRMKWNSQGVHLFCVDYPLSCQASVYL